MEGSLQVVNERGMWIVKKDKVVHSIHIKKETAIKVAKTIAHNHHTDLTIQRRNGDILRARP